MTASEKYVSGAEKNLTNFVMDTLQMTRKWKIIVPKKHIPTNPNNKNHLYNSCFELAII
jgi:hypothetical protein